MTLQAQVDNDIKTHAREGYRAFDTLRMLKAAMKNSAIGKGRSRGRIRTITEAAAIIRSRSSSGRIPSKALKKAVAPSWRRMKRRNRRAFRLSAPGAVGGGGEAIVKEAIAEVGATTKEQNGRGDEVAGAKAAGRVDGKTLSSEVPEASGLSDERQISAPSSWPRVPVSGWLCKLKAPLSGKPLIAHQQSRHFKPAAG